MKELLMYNDDMPASHRFKSQKNQLFYKTARQMMVLLHLDEATDVSVEHNFNLAIFTLIWKQKLSGRNILPLRSWSVYSRWSTFLEVSWIYLRKPNSIGEIFGNCYRLCGSNTGKVKSWVIQDYERLFFTVFQWTV